MAGSRPCTNWSRAAVDILRLPPIRTEGRKPSANSWYSLVRPIPSTWAASSGVSRSLGKPETRVVPPDSVPRLPGDGSLSSRLSRLAAVQANASPPVVRSRHYTSTCLYQFAGSVKHPRFRVLLSQQEARRSARSGRQPSRCRTPRRPHLRSRKRCARPRSRGPPASVGAPLLLQAKACGP